MENFNNVINSKNLNYWRTKRGLSQKELAEKSKVSIRTINKIENNHEKPSQKVQEKVFKQLRNALNCSSKELSCDFTEGKISSLSSHNSRENNSYNINETLDKLHKLKSIKVNQTTLTNLEEVGKLYNTSPEEIIDMASALFVDFAEKCLEKENENFSKNSFYYLITKFADTHHFEHHYDKKYDDIFNEYVWGSDNFGPDTEGESMVNDVTGQINMAIQNRDVFFKTITIPEQLMSIYPEAYLPEPADYNPINTQLDKLLKTRRMKEIFIHDERRVEGHSSSEITFSNKSNVIFYTSDKETHAEIKKQEKEKIQNFRNDQDL